MSLPTKERATKIRSSDISDSGFIRALWSLTSDDRQSFTRTDAQPAYWECTGETDYTLRPGTRTEVGTTVTLYINEENRDLLDVFLLGDLVKNTVAS